MAACLLTIFHDFPSRAHTPRPLPLPFSWPFPSCALSIRTTLDRDPVADPPKGDWWRERSEFCFAVPFCVSQFSSSLSYLPALSFPFCLPPPFYFLCPVFISSSVESYLRATVGCTYTDTRLLPPGWIFKAREAQRSKLDSLESFYCGLRRAHATAPSWVCVCVRACVWGHGGGHMKIYTVTCGHIA